MHSHLKQEENDIKSKIFKMLDLAIESIQKSISALQERDTKAAGEIIENDKRTDRLEKLIDHECLTFLVTRQPAASDLRFILAVMKINTELERIGDLAVSIARQTQNLDGQALIKPLVDIPRMGEIVIEMITDVLNSLTTKDISIAHDVIERDDVIDNINEQIYRELMTIMGENPGAIDQSISLIRVAKALERIGDHAKNIGEQVIFFVEGRDVRHNRA